MNQQPCLGIVLLLDLCDLIIKPEPTDCQSFFRSGNVSKVLSLNPKFNWNKLRNDESLTSNFEFKNKFKKEDPRFATENVVILTRSIVCHRMEMCFPQETVDLRERDTIYIEQASH